MSDDGWTAFDRAHMMGPDAWYATRPRADAQRLADIVATERGTTAVCWEGYCDHHRVGGWYVTFADSRKDMFLRDGVTDVFALEALRTGADERQVLEQEQAKARRAERQQRHAERQRASRERGLQRKGAR